MTEKRNIGAEILDGIRELKAGEAGRVVNVPPVAEVREKTGLSQARFAASLGVSVRTLQDREQGRPPGSLGRRAHPLADCVQESGGSARGGLTLTRSPVAGPASRRRSRPMPGDPPR